MQAVSARPPVPQERPLAIDESVATLLSQGGPATWQVGAPFKFTTLDGHNAVLAGARFGLLKRERHVVSLAGFTRVGAKDGGRDAAGHRRSLDFCYGGLLLGWEADGLALLQSYGHLLVGAGRARVEQRNTHPLLVLEPELGLTWKLARALRGTVGVSWRGAWGDTGDSLGRTALDGWAASLGLLVGLYPDSVPVALPTEEGEGDANVTTEGARP